MRLTVFFLRLNTQSSVSCDELEWQVQQENKDRISNDKSNG